MDGTPQSKPGGGGGGGAGPAPFLLKTYDMVDDSATDEIVSWTSNRNSFVVWNPPEFARLLLPTYFKHNNFSSFIRQLNTYGFRKIDPERWEFANEDFVKDQRYLLKNIHRRKPIHSHSNRPVDPERTAFLEEIEKLTQEKTALEKSVSSYKQQQPPTKLQLEDLIRRVDDMELRQDNLLTSLKKSVQNPGFVYLLAQKLESMDFSAYNKKRRLPPDDNSHMVPDDSFLDNHSPSRPEFGNIFHHDFANKLRLELSNMNMVSHSTQSSNEEGGSPQIRLSEGSIRDALMTPGGIPMGPDQLELSDTGTSITFNMDSSFVHKTGPCEIPSLNGDEDAEGRISCRLNLSLASSTPASQSSGRMPQSVFGEIGKPSDWIYNNRNNEYDPLATNNQVVATGQAPVNDGFWEQFLTERPGSSDATTIYRQENQRTGHGLYQNSMNLQNLTL